MKLCITAVSDTLDAELDPRFGRCQYFLIMDSETMESEIIANDSSSSSHGAGIQAAQAVADSGAQVVITGNVGPNAFRVLAAAGIKVVTGASGSVKYAVEEYKKGNLQEISSPTVGGHLNLGRRQGKGR